MLAEIWIPGVKHVYREAQGCSTMASTVVVKDPSFIYLFIGYTGANKHVKDLSVTQMQLTYLSCQRPWCQHWGVLFFFYYFNRLPTMQH